MPMTRKEQMLLANKRLKQRRLVQAVIGQISIAVGLGDCELNIPAEQAKKLIKTGDMWDSVVTALVRGGCSVTTQSNGEIKISWQAATSRK